MAWDLVAKIVVLIVVGAVALGFLIDQWKDY